MTSPLPAAGQDLHARIARLLQRLRLHTAALTVLPLLPTIAGAAWLVAGGFGARVGWLAAGVLCLLGMLVGWLVAVRRHHLPRLLRRIDAAYAGLEDSAGLALQPDLATGTLQRLQQARAAERLHRLLADPATERRLRVGVRRRDAAAAGLAGAMLVATALGWTALRQAARSASSAAHGPVAAGRGTAVRAATLTVTAPAYTGLALQTIAALDARVAADSRIAWSLELDRDATAAMLVWSDGVRTPLQPDGARRWHGERMLAASALYRVQLAGAPPIAGDPLQRIDTVPDLPPTVTATEPAATLTLVAAGQTRWSLAFEAEDDHGLGTAVLSVSLAHGSGEQIKVTDRTMPLDGSGDAHHRRYRQTLDLAALGDAQGDDLIVQLDVADNHAPTPQHGSSPHLVLRWPAEAASESEGMDVAVQKTLPAYFRSQRQIIIDTEALIAERATLSPKVFAARADGLGVDQKVLRQRYGEFLGEGFEPQAEHAPAEALAEAASAAAGQLTSSAPGGRSVAGPLGRSGGKSPDDTDAVAAIDAQARAALGGLPPEAPGAAPRGDAEHRALAEFGHVHDQPEAATLLDPATRDTLKRALAAMWQAELHLRQAELQPALPPEYVALDAIKEVQQAERIYRARAGQTLPQVDPDRRLTGDRQGLADRAQPLPPPSAADTPAPAIWAALAGGRTPDLAPLAAWVHAHPDRLSDPLGVLAALDRLRRAPACRACADALQAQLWPLLPVPPTAVRPRSAPDAAGAAYLDALRSGAAGAVP